MPGNWASASAPSGLEDDEAARWLDEHEPKPAPVPPKAATKSKALHRWRRRRAPAPAAEGSPLRVHPRPDCRREHWQSLNGPWEFGFDDDNRGLAEAWWSRRLPLTIRVPYPYQSRTSGIGESRVPSARIWYRRGLQVARAWQRAPVRLHFGAVDYSATVFFDGMPVTSHRGGHTPFFCDLSRLQTRAGEHTLALRVLDTESLSQPRGKRGASESRASASLSRTTGIWPARSGGAPARASLFCGSTCGPRSTSSCSTAGAAGELEGLTLTATATLGGETASSVDTGTPRSAA